MEKKTNKNYGLHMIAVFLAALVCLIFIYQRFAFIGTDGSFYALLGKNIAEGRGLSIFGVPHTIFSPFLPLSIAFFYFFLENIDLAAHVAVMFFALASIPLLYFVLRRMFNSLTAILATLFFAANGYFLWPAAVTVTSQIVAGFFAILISFLFWYAGESLEKFKGARWQIPLFLGMSIGAAYLARPEYLILFFLAPCYLFLYRRKTHSFKYIAFQVFFLIIGFLMLATPYLLFLEKNLGHFAFTGRTNEAVMITTSLDYESVGVSGGRTSIIVPPDLQGGVLHEIFVHNGIFFKHVFKGLLETEQSFLRMFGLIGIILFAYGLRALIISQKWRILSVFGAVLLPVFAIAIFQGGSPNYLVQFIFIFAIFMAIGLIAFTREVENVLQLRDSYRKLFFIIFIFGATSYFFFLVIQLALFLPPDYSEKEFKLMGTWMATNLNNAENSTLFARKPDVAFYAGTKWEDVPQAKDVNTLVDLMRDRRIRYISVDDRYFALRRPELAPLLDPLKAPPALHMLHKVEWEGHVVLLYELAQ